MKEYRTISMGDIDVLKSPATPKVAVGNDKVITASVAADGQIFVVGKDIGTSSLLLLDANGKAVRHIVYNVPSANMSAKLNAIRHQLRDVEGITVEVMDGRVVIDGEVLVRADFDRVLQVQDGNPAGTVLNLVTLSKISRAAIGQRMQREINRNPAGNQ